MSTVNFLEVVEIENGEVVLRRADTSPGSSAPLVSIRCSAEIRTLLGRHIGDVASAMIGAGMQMAEQLQDSAIQEPDDDEPHLLH